MAGSVCDRGHAWQGGMCGRGCTLQGVYIAGVCVAGAHAWQGRHVLQGLMHGRGGMCGKGHAWQGACVPVGGCVAGGVHGGMHGRGHVWQGGAHGSGACMKQRWLLKQVVRILLECILVSLQLSNSSFIVQTLRFFTV